MLKPGDVIPICRLEPGESVTEVAMDPMQTVAEGKCSFLIESTHASRWVTLELYETPIRMTVTECRNSVPMTISFGVAEPNGDLPTLTVRATATH
jgi:hypothetical protein